MLYVIEEAKGKRISFTLEKGAKQLTSWMCRTRRLGVEILDQRFLLMPGEEHPWGHWFFEFVSCFASEEVPCQKAQRRQKISANFLISKYSKFINLTHEIKRPRVVQLIAFEARLQHLSFIHFCTSPFRSSILICSSKNIFQTGIQWNAPCFASSTVHVNNRRAIVLSCIIESKVRFINNGNHVTESNKATGTVSTFIFRSKSMKQEWSMYNLRTKVTKKTIARTTS